VTLDELLADTAWHAEALCREYPNVDWFPERGADPSQAKAMYARCLVHADCLDAGLPRTWKSGWNLGGVGTVERKRLRTARGEIVVSSTSEAA
jgi:hypothetical protein